MALGNGEGEQKLPNKKSPGSIGNFSHVVVWQQECMP